MEVGKVIKRGEDLFSLLFTFENNGNLFWVYQNGNLLPGKKTFHTRKKSGNMTLPPQKNMPVRGILKPMLIHVHINIQVVSEKIIQLSILNCGKSKQSTVTTLRWPKYNFLVCKKIFKWYHSMVRCKS